MAEEYDQTKLIAGETVLTWKSISFTQRQFYSNKIQRNNVTTYDSFLNFGQSETFDYYSINVA